MPLDAIPLTSDLPNKAIDEARMIACALPVLIVELLNSALEATIDKMSPEYYEVAKLAKNLGSGTAALTLINIAIAE